MEGILLWQTVKRIQNEASGGERLNTQMTHYDEIAVRIKNVFDPKPEEDYVRSVLEPDGWQLVKIEDTSSGQRHIIFKRPNNKK